MSGNETGGRYGRARAYMSAARRSLRRRTEQWLVTQRDRHVCRIQRAIASQVAVRGDEHRADAEQLEQRLELARHEPILLHQIVDRGL